MTADELAAYKTWADEQAAKDAQAAQIAADKAAARSAVLAKLGLTAEEASTLLG